MGQPTAKITIEGQPAHVEAIITKIRACFEVKHQSKDHPIPLRPEEIRVWVRVEVEERVLEGVDR